MSADISSTCPPGYWRTAACIGQAQALVASAVDELLPLLGGHLDPQGQWTQRFWRMALGPYLWSLLSYACDRMAEEPAAGQVETPAPPAPAHLFFSSREFVLTLSDGGALQAWLDTAFDTTRSAGTYPDTWSALRFERRTSHKRTPEAAVSWKARLRRLVFTWEGSADIVHYAAPFSHANARRLTRQSRGRIRRLSCPEQTSLQRYDGAVRQALYAHCRTGALSPLADHALAVVCALLPTAFVEQLDELHRWTDGQQLPSLLVSALGHERSPYFVALADRACARGAAMVGIQHGGYYGQTDPTWSEIVETQISDHYCTWGYRHHPKHRPMPSIRLAQLETGSNPALGGKRLLWAYAANVTGATLLSAIPHFRRAVELNDYFIAALDKAKIRLGFELALRPYPRGVDPLIEDWTQRVAGLVLEPGKGRSLLEHAAEHDLTVFSFPGATGFLEFLHADRPAILFSPDDLCPLRPQAQAVFQALADVGLYATDAAAFERSVEEFMRDGERWWHAPQRRQARERFREEFALSGTDIVPVWATQLQEWADATRMRQTTQDAPSSKIPETLTENANVDRSNQT